MARAIVLVLDSFGIGAAPDAEKYGDQDANTFGHIREYREQHNNSLKIPNLDALGLSHAAALSAGSPLESEATIGQYAACNEQSFGKDTPSGHWEMMGLPVMFDWGYFPKANSFPKDILDAIAKEFDIPKFLGNCHASGTEIINKHGDEHCETGALIVYTSADSVFQIAAHEETFGLQKLYDVCDFTRKLVDDYNIGRVIARPFVGSNGNYTRTGNRRDIATPPHGDTFLDTFTKNGGHVVSIGKIADIFAHRGISEKIKADGNMALFDATLKSIKESKDNSLIFTNFVDFDSKYGHRRDIEGYATALEDFDQRIPELLDSLNDDDLVIMTADHGCDPSAPGSDHTRENIPVLCYRKGCTPGSLGVKESFAFVSELLKNQLKQ